MLNITKKQLEKSTVKSKKLEITSVMAFNKKQLKELLKVEEDRAVNYQKAFTDTKDRVVLIKAKLKLL